MTKFVLSFFAILVFQAVLAHHYHDEHHHYHEEHHHDHEVQELLKQVQSISRDASSAIQNVEEHQHRHALYSQAHEFAHNVHEVAYHLQHALYHSEGQTQHVLEHVVRTLREVVHSVQQAMHHEPNYLQAQLRTQVQNVADEAQRLAQVAQQEQQGPHHIGEEVQDALDDLLAAVQQLQVRNRLQSWDQEEIRGQIQETTNKASRVIQDVSSDDQEVVEEHAHHSRHYGHVIGKVVHKLQKEVQNHDIRRAEVRDVLQQIINKLSEIRASLEQAGRHTHGRVQAQVVELRNELKTNVHNVAVQLERLVQLVHSANLDEHEMHHVKDFIYSVLARSLAGARQLQRQVEATVRYHQEE